MGVVRAVGAIVVAIVIAALTGVSTAFAQPTQDDVFTLAPGASTTLRFEGFCAQFGEPFPGAVGVPSSLAPEPVRAALAIARAQGAVGNDQDALQVQYAIWQLLGQSGAPQGGELTRDIINRSRTAQAPSPQGATSLLDAAAAGQVQLQVQEFAPVGAEVEIAPGVRDHFYGRGTMSVTNLSNQELILYFPIGTLVPATAADEQDLVAYAIPNDPAQAAQVTAIATAPAATAAATAPAATVAPTVAPTVAAPTAAPTVAAPTAAPTAAPLPTATRPQTNQLPQTSGLALPIPAILLLTLALGVAVLRRGLRR